MSDEPRAKPKKKDSRHRTGRGPGRRTDIPWELIRSIYIEGEIQERAGGVVERAWPSQDELSVRFNVTRAAIVHHAQRNGWTLQREEHRRKAADVAQARTEASIQNSAALWGQTAARVLKQIDRSLTEIEYAYRYAESLVPTPRGRSPKGGRPSGGDAASQGDGHEDGPPAAPLMREPMSARDQSYLTQARARDLETLKALLFGTTPTATTPTAAQPSGGVPAEIAKNPRVNDALRDFLDTAASRNKALPPAGG